MRKNAILNIVIVLSFLVLGFQFRQSDSIASPEGIGNVGSFGANSNWLIKKYRKQLVLECSSNWNGWPVSNLLDQNSNTSWFSAARDAAAFKQQPWVIITFPQDVEVSRVTALGNRDARWSTGFSINRAKFELLDSDNKVVYTTIESAVGDLKDFDVHLKNPVVHVRRIKFTSLVDEGDANGYSDVALGELQIE
ncbi:MAG: discoidin domain-containing protein [Candidatus Melainabacteria bacterium]|nr:discoidin domain-containing protein [Candidatus Melainabacteria bacterium]